MNELKQIDEFRKVLANYQLSDAARQTLLRTRLVLLVGPTSSGKNTIINELLKSGDFHAIVSDTTRQPRVNNGVLEQDGREYWFRTEAELLADLQAGSFLEAAIIHDQQVSGISIRELETAASEGKIAINEVEVVGADHIHAAKPGAQIFFIIPPSFDEWMVRMRGRGTLPADEINRRLQSAITETETALSRDYYQFIVNETFMHSVHDIHQIAVEGIRDTAPSERGRQHAVEFLAEIQKVLATV